MKRVILTRGLPASGKTTWSKEMLQKNPGAFKRINKDDLRVMLDDGDYTSANEKMIITVRDYLILQSLAAGKHVIVDDTNLNPIHGKHIKELVKGIAVVEYKDFLDVPIETCIERDSTRTFRKVGEATIREMYDEFIKPKVTITYAPPAGLPEALIVDVDGTIALLSDRSPFDYSKVAGDPPNENIVKIIGKLVPHYKIIVVSAREDVCKEATMAWLDKYLPGWSELHMRKANDGRKDAIVKREIFENDIAPKYGVVGVFDDRNQVVNMWREIGLTCLQVAPGNF